MEVLQESGIALVQTRQQAVLEALEVVLVRVPAAVGNRHKVDARFDQSAGEQARLAEGITAVELAHGVGLQVQIKGPLGGRRADKTVSFFVKDVPRLNYLGRLLDLLLVLVQTREHGVAPFQAGALGVAGQAQIAHLETAGTGIVHDLERVVLIAQESRDAAVKAAVDVASQLNEREHAVTVAALLGDHGAVAGEGERRVEFVAAHHEMIGRPMAAVLRIMTANEAELIGLPRQEREMFDQPHAGEGCRQCAEFAANFRRGFRFWIKGVDVARSALHPKENAIHRPFRCPRACRQLLQTQKSRQRQPEGRQATDA